MKLLLLSLVALLFQIESPAFGASSGSGGSAGQCNPPLVSIGSTGVFCNYKPDENKPIGSIVDCKNMGNSASYSCSCGTGPFTGKVETAQCSKGTPAPSSFTCPKIDLPPEMTNFSIPINAICGYGLEEAKRQCQAQCGNVLGKLNGQIGNTECCVACSGSNCPSGPGPYPINSQSNLP